MARAKTSTLLPLDRFAAIVGIHPLHFNQMYVSDIAEPRVCGMPFLQSSWQSADRIGREEIAQAISDAESTFAREAGFWPAPKYIESEFHRLKLNPYWLVLPEIKLDYGYVKEVGLLTKSLIGNAAIVYSDVDGDGYLETATITIPTTVTDPDEIVLYYPGYSTDEYEIRPIEVSIAGGNATITCRRELLYLEDLVTVLNPTSFDGANAANFLATADVYRRYFNTAIQGAYNWLSPLCSTCGGTGCESCTTSTQTICTNILDKRLSILKTEPAVWDTDHFDTVCYYRNPDQVTVNYLSGKSSNYKMDPEFERAITYLAIARLDRMLCACDHIKAFSNFWREDLALNQSSQSGSASFSYNSRVFDCPFGTSRGALFAWRVASRYKIGEGI